MTHTPGPWKICHVGHVRPFSSDFRLLADDVNMDRWQANAALIEAVPDLLAALQYWLNTPQGCTCLPSSGCSNARAREQARAAVAKATGA